MLRELRSADPQKRWFADEYLDLFVWRDDAGRIVQFQLAYARNTARERVVHWRAGKGLSHAAVDSGEDEPGRMKASPILVEDGPLDREELLRQFRARSRDLPAEVADFVVSRLRESA